MSGLMSWASAHPGFILTAALLASMAVIGIRLRYYRGKAGAAEEAAEAAEIRRRLGKLASEAARKREEAAKAYEASDKAMREAENAASEARLALEERERIAAKYPKP